MDTVECPYCSEDVKINHDDGAHYSEDRSEPMECPECEKNFMVNASSTWYFEGEKADCLNDGKHDWQTIHGHPREHYINKRRCSMCYEETSVKNLENIKV